MKKTGSIKRTAVVLSAFIGSAFLFTGVTYVNAESDTGLKTINYGTSENMIFADKGFAAFSVTDEDGNAFSDGEFVITDSEGSPVASWRGNPMSQNFSYAGGATLIGSKSKVLVYGKQLPDFTGGNGFTRTTSVKTGENTATLISPDGAGSFVYGQTFESTSRYIIYGETELTVPAHSFGMYSDAAWSDRAVQWGFAIGEYKGPEDDYSDFISLYNFSCNNFAGKLNIQQFADGKYPYRTEYGNGGGGGNVHNRITIDDKVYEYEKKTINLHEKYPTYFNEDSTHDMDTFGTQRNFSFAKDSVSPYQTAGLFFMSGNLVTAPIPDENGNVTVYVNKKDYYFTMMTDFGWESGGGGGTTGMGGYADSKAVFSFSTPSVPENGFALKNLPEGEYTVKSANFPDKYESYSGTFTVTNESGSGVPECRIVIRNKKFAINIISENGTVTADSMEEGKVSAGSKVTLSCTPDEGCRFSGYEISDADGSISLSDDGSFEMPYSDVTVRALFDKIYAGDLDGNGCINAADFLYMAKYLTGIYVFPDEGWYKAADINGDGMVNIADYVLLRSRLLV